MSELEVFQNWSITQSLYTFIIGILTVYIAYQQYKANKYKIRMDLYERRFRVYQITRDTLHLALSSSNLKQEQYRDFEDCIAESRFIFNPEMHDYLKFLIIRLHNFQDNQTDEELKENTMILSEREAFISSEISNLPAKFSTYLSLNKI